MTTQCPLSMQMNLYDQYPCKSVFRSIDLFCKQVWYLFKYFMYSVLDTDTYVAKSNTHIDTLRCLCAREVNICWCLLSGRCFDVLKYIALGTDTCVTISNIYYWYVANSMWKRGEHLLMFTFRAGVEPGDLLTLVNEWKVPKICHRLFCCLESKRD